MKRTTWACLAAAVLFLAAAMPHSRGLVIFGDDAIHKLPPPNGAPWRHVGKIANGKGSAIYLGNRYAITAEHVQPITPITFNGVVYEVDLTFGKEGAKQIASTDIKVVRLTKDPGLPPLPLIGPADSDLGQPCTVIGWGVGKGEPIPGQGWKWGIDTTSAQRWGTNVTNATLSSLPEGAASPQYIFLTTDFDSTGGPDEAQIANADSGAALFIKADGVWKLAGTGADATTLGSGLYDRDPAAPGMQPDRSSYIRIKAHREEILRVIGL